MNKQYAYCFYCFYDDDDEESFNDLETDVETQSTENVDKAPENTSHKSQKTPTSAPISSRDGPYQQKH